MRVAFLERWRVYVVWLGSGVSGILPAELRMTLGPIAALLPVTRQVAEALGPWLAALLAERQRQGLAGEERRWLTGALDEMTRARPFARGIERRSAGWLKWLLEGELRRLVVLVEAPEGAMWRRDWLAWEVRYWALAVRLARIGQVYAALERTQEAEQAQRLLKGALARVWRQAVRAERAA